MNSLSAKQLKNQKRVVSESSSDEGDIDDIVLNDDSEDEENYDAECLFCTGQFSADQQGEQWVKCRKCYRWAHEDCGAEEVEFICPMCEKRGKV